MEMDEYSLMATLDGEPGNPFNGTVKKIDDNNEGVQCTGSYSFNILQGTLDIDFNTPNTNKCSLHSLSAKVGMAEYSHIIAGNPVEVTVYSDMFYNQPRQAKVSKIENP